MRKDYKFDFGFFDRFHNMCFIVSPEGEILEKNNMAHEKLNSFTDKNFFELFEKKDKDKFIKIFNDSVLNDKNEEIETKFIIDNKTIDVDIFITPNIDSSEENKNSCFILAKDITEQKQKELDLLRFFNIAENTVNPLQITDLNGKMIYVNPAFVKASGYEKEELLGKNPNIFSSKKHSKRFWSRMWDTINKGKVWVGEVENRRKSGEPFYTQVLISPIINSKSEVAGFFGIHRDLSEKRTLEKQLIHTQKMESIGTLAAGIAHEVGNPLASISALVQVALRYSTEDLVKEKLELVKNQVNRISKIIRDLVDFSRPSNYELKLTDINKNIIEAVEITKVGVKAKDLVFDLDLSENIPMLPLVADQIQQVFVNILLNAVDAILESDKKEKRLTISSEIFEDEVILTFSDTGTGISEENLIKIFEPFFTSKKEGKGTGLGLWVSYGIIKSFQGDIKVTSELGKGATFTITLPIQA